ncbi:MAG: hypothetical protein PVH63_07960 [Balneolaceae bacterium]|jgi:hypothetical protein
MGDVIMSKKKSLGSSPIGFHSESLTMGFIPDLGVSESNKNSSDSFSTSTSNFVGGNSQNRHFEKEKMEKKIVSYNLEVDLVSRVKKIADKKGMYYSSLVSQAIRNWIAHNA